MSDQYNNNEQNYGSLNRLKQACIVRIETLVVTGKDRNILHALMTKHMPVVEIPLLQVGTHQIALKSMNFMMQVNMKSVVHMIEAK